MASALPVIMSDVGGARDIVEPGETGWLIEPTPTALAAALRGAQAQRETLPSMGRWARAVAEARFDGAGNDSLIVDLCLELAQRRAEQRRETHTLRARGERE